MRFSLPEWISFLQSEAGHRNAGGSISRFAVPGEIDGLDLEAEVRSIARAFRPLMEAVRPDIGPRPKPEAEDLPNADDPEGSPEGDSSSEQPDETEIPAAAKPYTIDDALDDLFMDREAVERLLAVWRHKRNLILQGAPGVGKSFVARRLAYALMGYADDTRVETVQFHQSYSYEDFVQGYRPFAGDNKQVGFELKDGVFVRFRNRALADPNRRYVFIIDEINRGNLSKILGELMLLIESDKRGPEWGTALAYARNDDPPFYVPDNIYILGMMNTADRSLSMVDYALRRRFAFETLKPQFDSAKFRTKLGDNNVPGSLVDELVQRMMELNATIADDRANLGPGFQIGHSFFVPNGSGPFDDAWYRRVIETEICPLLEEYWFDDPTKADEWRGRLLDGIT